MGQLSPPLLLPRGVSTAGPGVAGIPWLLYGTGATVAVGFPTQFSGLRYYHGGVKELCLVATADAPAGMGGVWRIRKGGVDYAVYLVETSDPLASAVRIRTSTGVKAARLKT